MVEIILGWASTRPGQRAFSFLDSAGEESEVLRFGEIDERARAVAGALQAHGGTGERALLLYPPGLEFVVAFLGCLYAGTIAVPSYPPRLHRGQARLRSIASDAGARFVLTTAATTARLEALCGHFPELAGPRWLATDDLPAGIEDGWREVRRSPGDPAFLQYTSGSTAEPKGVIVTHGNLLHNEEMIRRAFGQSEESVVVGWLPLYHDMGLIGNVLQPLYLGVQAILMSPLTFLQRPSRWLEAISRFRATTSGGPNFAYELCLRKIGDTEREGLDLSSWRVAFNGAEPVRWRTLTEFAAAFAHCGFRREAFYPCYGLAEATLFATGGAVAGAPRMMTFASAALEENRVIPQEGEGGRELVSCGAPWMGQEVTIVDPESRQRCPPGRVGEIWISGPSVAQGYWGRAKATEEGFRALLADEPAAGPFLRTGDLGFSHGGDLFVTGRLKDLVILSGRNLYPQDIEQIAEGASPCLRPSCGAAFAVESDTEERLVIVWELDSPATTEIEPTAAAIRQRVSEELEAPVHEVVFLAPGTIPKTSSGKIRRHACRAALLRGELEVVGRSAEAAPGTELIGGDDSGTLLDREELLALPGEERLSALGRLLSRELARVARMPAHLVSAGEPLTRLGLESLSALELQQSLERALGVSVTLTDLLSGIDLDTLTRRLHERLARVPTHDDPPLLPRAAAAVEAPLSYGQKALWFLTRLAEESGPYHIAALARVRPARSGGPDLDAAGLRRALDALSERHPILRTTFHEQNGEPRQRVSSTLPPDFIEVDAVGLGEADLLTRLEREAYRPFELTTGPLLRMSLFRRDPGEDLLLIAVHHIVADFWTLALWMRELSALYTGQSLPSLRLGYVDYVLWQAERMAGPEGERLWAHWRDQLTSPPPSLALPTDRPRPPMQSYRGGAEAVRLDPKLSQAVVSLARTSGATLFATLLAGFLALLHRYSGQEDLLVGSPAAGRGRRELADVAGYFVNLLPLRADLSGDPTFAAFLSRVRQTALRALEHQDYPYLLIAERLQPDRDLSRSPLLQAMFVFQKAERLEDSDLAAWALGEAGARLGFSELVFESRTLPERYSQFDLTLRMAEVNGSLAASLQYSSALFDATTARRTLGHLRELLAGATAAPDRLVAELPLLSAAERAQLFVEWSPSDVAVAEVCLHELFAAQAARAPEAEALVAGALRLSYGELAARAFALAGVLRGLGVGPEERVGVCLERSAALVVALLGVLASGGAYVPLDPTYPSERLALMLEDSGVQVLLTQEELVERLPEVGTRTVLLDALGWTSGSPIAGEIGPAPLPENLAYLIYTSGSTGRPKAVALEHRSAVTLVRWARQVWSEAELSGVLFATSICFDLSIFEVFVPLAWGGRVILADDALALPRLSAAREVTLVNTVPSVMAELLRQRALPASVRTVNLAGEALQRPLVEALYRLGTVERVWNLYGPSEDTTYSTAALQARSSEDTPGIGRPIAGTRAYVLDRGIEPTPVGVPGELHLGGAGLARGYFDRPELTAERFRPDPWSEQRGGRLYGTGDLVRYRVDGELEFLGRLDHQVKVRGFRVELGEVEARLAEHPDVSAVAVTVSGGTDSQMAAYVVVRREPAPDAAELRGFLQARLPGHMVPTAFVLLPELPLNVHGKLDRNALPTPGKATTVAFVAPRSGLESRLAAIWEEVLGVGPVGVHDNFFALGGHSLKAMQVLACARDSFGVDLPVRSLFDAPTVAQQTIAIVKDLAGRAGRETLLEALATVHREPDDR